MATDQPSGAAAPVEYRDDVTVDLVKHSASDSDVLWAARVSTAGEQSLEELTKDPERSKGLLNYLMRDRHGSPFEHNSMTFFISAPIFVFREFMRHRVGWCLAGGTEVTLESEAGHLSREPIKDLYQRWHGSAQDRRPGGRVRCYDEDSLRPRRTRIVDVMESGTKPLLRITTGSGRVLRCSVDHAILTPDGWRKAGELAAGDAVMTAAGTLTGRESAGHAGHDGGIAGPDRISAVADDGEEMTYDLSVEGPWHNFLADGIAPQSYNEESGRYRELQPVFYVPGPSASSCSRAGRASTSSSTAPRSSTRPLSPRWRSRTPSRTPPTRRCWRPGSPGRWPGPCCPWGCSRRCTPPATPGR